MDKGTIVRTSTLLVALINQILVIYHKSPLPIKDDQLEQLISLLFTFVTSGVAWYKNNYVTRRGHQQKEVLKQANLTK
ncbi:phage holin [Priestia koreensis]|uniref:Holin n=1 Tax=Priestia koreensis TaxID=284581 RepID=A0A0M0LAU9_9BACI|nr:phage holin [Priestia koreensis]KOO48181.1 holin [Priestia koreensis]